MWSRGTAWYAGLPPRHKQSLLTVALFAVLSIVCIVVVALELDYRQRYNANKMYATSMTSIATFALALLKETEAAIVFAADTGNKTAFVAMQQQQRNVDDAYAASIRRLQLSDMTGSWSYVAPPSSFDGNMITRHGLTTIEHIRARLSFGEVIYDPLYTRRRYMQVIEMVIALMAARARDYGRSEGFVSFVTSSVLASGSSAYMDVHTHYAAYKRALASGGSGGGGSAAATTELKATIVKALLYQTLVQCLLRPLLDLDNNLRLDVNTFTYNVDAAVERFLREATKAHVLPSGTAATMQTGSFAPIEQLLLQLQHESFTEDLAVCARVFIVVLYVLLALVLLLLCLAVVEFTYLRVHDARQSAVGLVHDGVMHDVLMRVLEYVREIATFTLAPPSALRSMQDAGVAIVELQLKYLVGCLKAVEPALPSLLFPRQLAALAARRSEVLDPAEMVLAQPLRESLKKAKLELVGNNDEASVYLASMEQRTDLQERICSVALLYVSLTPLHNLGSEERRRCVVEHFQKMVSTIEECVYQHSGVMYSIALDRAVAVWNAAGQMADYCERAAMCGTALVQLLGALRAQRPGLTQCFAVNVGVVGGAVNIGVFGSEQHKIVGLFGPPTLRGMFVAQTNMFHGTHLTCDHFVRDAIQSRFLCKPIDLIPDGGCVYQILYGLESGKSELALQLAAYTAAFELFEKRCYKSALKAFRAYTKQYGYDTSVERIQALITGGKGFSL